MPLLCPGNNKGNNASFSLAVIVQKEPTKENVTEIANEITHAPSYPAQCIQMK